MHVVMSGDRHFDFTAKANNHASPAPGNPGFNEIQLHRIDKRQSEVKEMKDGALIATVRDKLSNDGKELTITTVSAGHPDQITVWARPAEPRQPTTRSPASGPKTSASRACARG